MSIHPAGKHALVANYGGGTVAVLPIQPDGRLGAASDVKRHQGEPGPARPTSAPPGSFAISGHDRPHAHMIQADASGRFVLAADLRIDQILVWRFDEANGMLTPNDPPSVALPPGDGPRHFAFHPKGHWFYSLQEEPRPSRPSTTTPRTAGSTRNRRSRRCRAGLPAPTSRPGLSCRLTPDSSTSRTGCTTRSPGCRSVNDGTLTWVGEGADPGRLSPELHDHSDRTVSVLVQSAVGRDRVFPDRCEVGWPDVHRAIHTGRLSSAPRLPRVIPDHSLTAAAKTEPPEPTSPRAPLSS